jgi:DNA repair ATPase RecN
MRVLSEDRKKQLEDLILQGEEIGKIAKIVGCDRKTVQRHKKQLDIDEAKRPFLLKLAKMIEDFDQHHYEELGRQFDDDEVVTYVEVYSTYREQFEDLFGTEKTQINFVIIQQILISRILRRLKINEALLEDIGEEIKFISKQIKKTTDPEQLQAYKEERHVLRSNLPGVSSELDKLNKQFKELEDNHRKGLEKLSATRKERLDKSVGIKSDWKELIKGLENRKNRAIQSKMAERLRMAEEIESGKLRKPIKFPDETYDAVLLDDQTDLGE